MILEPNFSSWSAASISLRLRRDRISLSRACERGSRLPGRSEVRRGEAVRVRGRKEKKGKRGGEKGKERGGKERRREEGKE